MARKNVTDDFKVFPERLSMLMKEQGVTQERLAHDLGIKRQTVGLYKNGQSMPDAAQLRNIAVFFNVSSDWLLGLTDFREQDNARVLAKDLGFSEQAIKVLTEHVEHFGNKYLIPTLNLLIEQETMPPDGFSVIAFDGISADEYAQLEQEAERNYERECEEWEKKKYIPILTDIEDFLSIKHDAENKYDITKEQILPKKQKSGLKGIRLNAIRTIPASDIAEKVLLSDIEEGLKKLKNLRLSSIEE
ncbi:DNA-binding helix-turn-helix protein [Lawsonibacter asaccharolyticus]|nr:DNA-binding helix-turn-helix protein [Lawsonibacter asaccharolyticus]